MPKVELVSMSEVQVRYQETDQMGVVYHANYLSWFEIGRTDYIRKLGYTYKQLEQQGILLPVVDIQCRYLYPATYDDQLLIYTKMVEHTGTKLTFSYTLMKDSSEQKLAHGQSIHLWTDKKMKRINITKHFPHLCQVFDLHGQVSE